MTQHIEQPIPPDTLNPAPLGPLSGNWHDDDAAAYEQDFASATEGPQERAGVPHAKPELAPVTRFVSSKFTVGTVNAVIVEPVMLLPADRNRKGLTLELMGTANGDAVTIGDSKSGCYNGQNLQAGVAPVVIALDNHTGGVWVYSQSANPIVVTALAVTV